MCVCACVSEIFARFYSLFELAAGSRQRQRHLCFLDFPVAVLGPFVMHFSFCAAQNVNVAT